MDHLKADAWQQRYEDANTGWDRGQANPILNSWLDSGQLQPCRIIVPGCGHGYEVIELAARGFDVTGIDFAEAPIKRLQDELAKRNIAAHVNFTDALSYEPQQPFDAVYEQTFLCAIAPSLRNQYVDQLRKWLRPNGKIYALFMQCDHFDRSGPPYHCAIDDMRALFPTTDWDWPNQPPQRVDHPSGLFELATVITKR